MTREVKLMVGIPASGKSTFIQQEVNRIESEGRTTCVVSRDYVRQSLLQPGESYFARETEVFNEFVRQVNEAMEIGFDVVFVDATHVTPASRKKILSKLLPDPRTSLTFVELECPVYIALARNEKREGFAKIPASAIINMAERKTNPAFDNYPDDNYGFKDIYIHTIYVGSDDI